MAKLHAVPSPSEPAARCRWHRWWGLCCCNQDLPGSTIKIRKGHQDLKSKCEYDINIYIYVFIYVFMYIVWYTILYYILYIYHCPWKTATVKSAHSSHGSTRCRGTVHMNFGATTLGGPFFVELVVVIQHHTGHLHQAKQRSTEKHSQRISRPEKNHWTNVEMAWTIHWSHDLPIEYVFIYIYIRLRYVFPPSKHMPQMSHVRASFQRPSSNRRRASFTRCPPSRFDRRFTPRAQIIMAFAGQTRLDLLGDHLEIGNMIYLFN